MVGVTITKHDRANPDGSGAGEYQAHVAGSEAVGRLTWVERGGVHIVDHTLVPPEIGGRGIAGMLVEGADGWPEDVLSNFELRTSTPPAQLATTVKRVLAEAEPGLPVFDIVPLDERLNRGLSTDRLVANLTVAFGARSLSAKR